MHGCWQWFSCTESLCCDRPQQVVTMFLFGLILCESNTLLLSSADSFDKLHLSRHLDHVSSPTVEGAR